MKSITILLCTSVVFCAMDTDGHWTGSLAAMSEDGFDCSLTMTLTGIKGRDTGGAMDNLITVAPMTTFPGSDIGMTGRVWACEAIHDNSAGTDWNFKGTETSYCKEFTTDGGALFIQDEVWDTSKYSYSCKSSVSAANLGSTTCVLKFDSKTITPPTASIPKTGVLTLDEGATFGAAGFSDGILQTASVSGSCEAEKIENKESSAASYSLFVPIVASWLFY